MLKAGLIQESTSDWALAPAFIRKQDGSVRWCIGYRILKAVIVKDIMLIGYFIRWNLVFQTGWAKTVKELFSDISSDKIINFLKETNLFNKL